MQQVKPALFKLVGDTQREHCIKQINQLYDAEHRFQVEIKPITKDRSKAQNRLYWKWINLIARELGDESEYYHIYFKRRVLSPIYLEDDNVKGFKARCLHLASIRDKVSPDEYEKLAEMMADAITTTAATVQQFTRYLEGIEHWAIKMGLTLPVSDDYNLAMGRNL